MKIKVLTIVFMILGYACGSPGIPQPVKHDTGSGTDSTMGKLNQEASLQHEFQQVSRFDLDAVLAADFNGDGINDEARFLRQKDKAGIVITDGKTRNQTTIGLGNSFEGAGDDLSWVDFWGIVKDSETYAIIVTDDEVAGDTVVHLENPSIVLRREEVGGGLIAFLNGKYTWIHQAD